MKKTALVLALLTLPVFADTHVYECEMFVVEAKNGLIRNVVKANYGAMVVDRGEQFMWYAMIASCLPRFSLNVTANYLA